MARTMGGWGRGGRGQSSESDSSSRAALGPCHPVVRRGGLGAVVGSARSQETTKKTRQVHMEGGKREEWGKGRSEGGARESRAGVGEGGRGRGTHPIESSVRTRRRAVGAVAVLMGGVRGHP